MGKKIKVKNNTRNKKAREKYVKPLPDLFNGIIDSQPDGEADSVILECSVCKNESVHKDSAIRASNKAEMILVIRDIINRFKVATDAKFLALSTSIQAQLAPIVEVSNKIAVSRSELFEEVSYLEDTLKSAFGITDEIDPKVADEAMFSPDTDDIFPELSVPPIPLPGEDPQFGRISNDIDTVLGENDPSDPEAASPSQDRPTEAKVPIKTASFRKGTTPTSWN